jgi:hypothetical protein
MNLTGFFMAERYGAGFMAPRVQTDIEASFWRGKAILMADASASFPVDPPCRVRLALECRPAHRHPCAQRRFSWIPTKSWR